MQRRAVLLLLLVTGLTTCRESPTSISGPKGGLALDVQLAASTAALDGGRVIIRGPTDTTMGILPGTTDTVGGLLPGAYDVALEGLVNGEVEVFGQTSGVQVTAGDNAVANIMLSSFLPELASLGDTIPSATIGLTFGSVSGAESYIVEVDTSAAFATAQEIGLADTTLTVTVDSAGLYYARVRALNAFGGRGRPGETDSADVVFTVFDSVSVGEQHVCALSDVEEVYCWGESFAGKLGTGQENIVPRTISSGLTFESVTAGGDHSCARTPDAAVLCWGRNVFGQVGIGTTSDSVIVPSEVQPSQIASQVNVGRFHTCGAEPDGGGLCWGQNSDGEIGDGTFTNRSSPTAVSSSLFFGRIHAGGSFSCGLVTEIPTSEARALSLSGAGAVEGEAHCWGRNNVGQLGDGTLQGRITPTPVATSQTFTVVEPSNSDHTCALTSGGVAYCWGHNRFGQLGTGTTGDTALAPVAVSGGLTFDDIDTGLSFTCGLTGGGQAYCWGTNQFGNLGTGDEVDSPVPVAVVGGLSFTQISAGGLTTCGVTGAGSIYCWGANNEGQLGDGTTEERSVPTKVLFTR